MKQSSLFAKTSKNIAEGEESKNAQLLIRGGFISKVSAGVYSFLPLGLRVLDKINKIIREEMDALGGEELLMPALVHKKYWQQTGRWDLPVIYKTGGKKNDFEYGLGWTHEEVITAIARNFISSYRDLPKALYQIQMKFRAEERPQGGLLRGREFLMKDLYSFHATTKDLEDFYKKVIAAYAKIFKRAGLKTIIAETSGGAFTKEYTHEFHVVNPAGEDTIYYCGKCNFCQNREIYNAAAHKNCAGEIASVKAVEVGNIFKLGARFSDAFNLAYLDKNGKSNKVIMGCYGIGPTRMMGTIVEEFNDEKGILWPKNVSPFKVHLLEIAGKKSAKIRKNAEEFYKDLQKSEIEVLYDDREISAGEKFNDADLIGAPYRAVISEKTGDKIEMKMRSENKTKLVSRAEFILQITKL